MSIKLLWNKFLKKSRGVAIQNSTVDRNAAIGSGSQVLNSSVDRFSYCGYDCKLINCKIGAFCSIADEVVIGGANHPIDRVSTSPVFYRDKSIIRKKFATFERPEDPEIEIGNDVWIGYRAMIVPGVKVGDGAVIGMGSVVTKDVGSYEIWAGNPARKIRDRFSEEEKSCLLDIKWWNWDNEKIRQENTLFISPQALINGIVPDENNR
jgi:acetyltransferase-like isoleucine patch superfamily enzyme